MDETPNRTEPLGRGWITAAITIGVFAALIGLDGMALSFQAVTAEMAPQFGQWAPGVPLGVDLAIFVFSGVDLLLARLDMRHPLPRAIVYAATAATIALNAAAGGTLAGRLAHVAMPLLWVGFTEVLRHIVRTQVGLATGTLREPIPAARWLLSPWPTAKLWRRMILWRVNSYTVALTHERQRLRAIAKLREKHGVLWRLYITPLERLELSLGPSLADTPATPPKATQPPGKTTTERQATTEPAVDHPKPQSATPRVVQPPKPSTPVDGQPTIQPTMDRWVEVGHPVYIRLKTATDKRPQQGAYRDALAEEVTRLIASGDLPDCYAQPSLTTAKRVRGAVEERFPELAPLHLVTAEAS